MGNNLHKGVVEVHEKNIGLPHKNQTVTPSKKKVILRYCTKSSDECAENSTLSFVSPL